MRVLALINIKSGALLGDVSPDDLERLLEETFRQAGHQFTAVSIEPDKLEEALSEAVSGPADVLIAAGGDGTIRAAAQAIMGTGKTLGMIPLGTFNRLAREIGMPLDPEEAVLACAGARAQHIDVARINGQLFLCNSLIGLPPLFTSKRQQLRNRPLDERVSGYWQVIGTILRSRRRLVLRIDDGEMERKLRVLSLAIANNPYDEEMGFGLYRPRLDTGRLGIYISKHRSGFGLMLVLLRALCGFWKGDEALEITTATAVEIGSSRDKLLVSNDGEVEYMETPLHYEIEPKALSMLIPVQTV